MSVAKTRRVVETYRCDACGHEFSERMTCSLEFRANDDVTFEWWNRGDYCPDCLRRLANGICRSIPVAERYADDAKKIPSELAVIEGEVDA